MPQVPFADIAGVRHFIERHALHGLDLGCVDIRAPANSPVARVRPATNASAPYNPFDARRDHSRAFRCIVSWLTGFDR